MRLSDLRYQCQFRLYVIRIRNVWAFFFSGVWLHKHMDLVLWGENYKMFIQLLWRYYNESFFQKTWHHLQYTGSESEFVNPDRGLWLPTMYFPTV